MSMFFPIQVVNLKNDLEVEWAEAKRAAALHEYKDKCLDPEVEHIFDNFQEVQKEMQNPREPLVYFQSK